MKITTQIAICSIGLQCVMFLGVYLNIMHKNYIWAICDGICAIVSVPLLAHSFMVLKRIAK